MKSISLNIGTYNIAAGRQIAFDMNIFAQDVLDQNLDIIGFQEVDFNASRTKYKDMLKEISEYTGYKYYAFYEALNFAFYNGTGSYGIGILSKYPIVSTETIVINKGDKPNGVESRVLGYAKIDVNGTVINFFTTHFTIRRDADRIGEFAIVAKKTKNLKNVIVTGDFNTKSLSEFDALPHLSKVNNPKTPFESFPYDHRLIDNIIYSSEFSLKENSAGMRINDHSDHYMLYATLYLNA